MMARREHRDTPVTMETLVKRDPGENLVMMEKVVNRE